MKQLVIVIFLCCVSQAAFAGTTGKIAGEVRDAQSREPVIGATIVIEGTSLGAAANIEGYYVILNVPPGKYRISATSLGYVKNLTADVTVSVDLTTTINFDLSQTVIEVGEEVVVTAEHPLVRRDLTSSESRVNAEEIKTLPVSEVSEVLSLQAGITTDKNGAIHIRGGRASEVAYWVDGVSVSDVYDGGQAVQVDNNSVQELQVISGTFNAEFGQAMSGIVNIITKDGERQYHGSLSAYTGDYVTSGGWGFQDHPYNLDGTPAGNIEDQIFYNLDNVQPFDNRNVEASLSGPIPGWEDVTFYASGRYFKSEGWLYGNRLFNTDESLTFDPFTDLVLVRDATDSVVGYVLPDYPVSMNNRLRYSGQAKLTYQISGSMKLHLSALGSRIDYKDYSHDWFVTPEGDVTKFDRGYNVSTLFTHTVGPTSFYTINASFFKKIFREYLFEDPFDPRYVVDPEVQQNRGLYEYISGGTNLHHFKRNTETREAKIDYTDQVSRLHQIKAGVEGKLHRLYLEDYNLIPDPITGAFVPTIPTRTGPSYEEYTEKPVEFSAYMQDKLEYERMVVNVGIRFDYFNSKGSVLADPQDPNVYLPQKLENQFHDIDGNGIQDSSETITTLEERLSYWYKKASPKYNISPRFGISYPITERGILHFSYGHFLQIPSFQHLFQKPGYKVTTAGGVQGVYGNPDLEAQKTVMYEFGLQQQLSNVLNFDVTVFYRDTREWVTTSPSIPVRDPNTATSFYTTYVNRDYANSRGVTLTLTKQPADMFSVNLSYTFQVAEGNNSNPDDEQAAQKDNKEPARTLTPLDWDQTHTANITLGIGEEDWGFYVLGRYGSGLPYTPVINQGEARGEDAARAVTKNSRRRPENYTVDLRLFKNVRLAPLTMSFFVKVFNLMDRRNEVDVYAQTGRATASPEAVGASFISGEGRVNTVSEYLIQPQFYSEPREIQVGIELNF